MKTVSGSLLVVDDDPTSRELLAHHLRINGYAVVIAADGREALQHLKRENFDLILLDIMMPGVGGMDVLQEVRRSFSLVDLPIIMVTAKDSSGDVVEAMRRGANDYLTKPIDFPVALARVQTHLLLRDLKQDLQIQMDLSESLIQSAYEMIISVDLERKITRFNPAAEKSFGYPNDEIVGQSVDVLYADPMEGQRVHDLTLRENGFTGEVRNRRKSGENFISYLSASVLRDKQGNPIGLMGISYDITKQKLLEAKQLEIERLREDFLSIASHDLKNPLTGVKGYAILLHEMLAQYDSLNPEAIQYVDRIKSLSGVMEAIVEDFLDFQALQDGQVQITREPLQINELAQAAAENNTEYARSKNITIQCELPTDLPEIPADKDRISQVVHNFVNNAVKFGRTGGHATLRTRDEDESVILEIVDDGPGIRPEEMDKLFVKYARLSTRPSGGEKSSGLGLAISRMLIDLHGGEIGARINAEKGMTFWFRLPKHPQ